MTYIVQPQIDCSTAQEFLDYLSPIGNYFKKEKFDNSWLFRGQGQDYPLVPSLFRHFHNKKNENVGKKLKSLTRRDIGNYSELLKVERDILIAFFDVADKRGLILPDDSQELRSFFERMKDDTAVERGLDGWRIESQGLSIMAMAQHYGIPTRLLDWSLSSYIAAYFAAEDACGQNKDRKSYPSKANFVVWAFRFPTFNKQVRYTPSSYYIRGVTAPGATNPNLKAQKGVFTLVERLYTKEADGEYLPLDKLLELTAKKQLKQGKKNYLLGYKLQKFTLPVSESKSLLYLLAKLDITPSAVYPGYKSILNDLQMQNEWDAIK